MSELKTNLGKSKLVPVGDMHCWEDLVEMMGCTVNISTEIFGPPLGAKFKEKTIRNPILEKLKQRLAKWKRLYLCWVG